MSVILTEEHLLLDGEPLMARIHRNKNAQADAPLVLHLHGGAFVSGSARDGDGVAALLSEAGATVMSADYPLAPGQPFPGALNHVYRLLKLVDGLRGRLGQKKSKLVVAGEEAGGNLAAAAAMMARDQQAPALAGQILVAPMLDACMATCSMRQADAGAVGCRWADGWSDYLGSADKGGHPYASPANASRLSGLAPALIVTAGDDPMRDESLAYADRLKAAGVETTAVELFAPTQWPCALQKENLRPEPWAAALREQFSQFFETLVFGRRVALSPVISA